MATAKREGGYYLGTDGQPQDANGQPVKELSAAEKKDAAQQQSATATTTPPATTAPGELSADFPGRDDLAAANLTTVDAVRAASDEQLLAVKGIGPATLKEIREALK